MNEIKAVLKRYYNISADNITPAVGGWSAAAYKIETGQESFFLKEYDKKRCNTTAQLEKLNLCMDIASWLENNTGLNGRINAPLLTAQGSVRAETQSHVYLLFSYIDGVTPQGEPLTLKQQEELADIVGELHCVGADVPFDVSSLKETYEIPCTELLKMPRSSDDTFCLNKHYDVIMQSIEQAHKMAKHVKSLDLPLIICHTDIHGWNLMQSDRLILIDWESLKYTPVEADLYTFWGDWYWGDSKWGSYWDSFLPVYSKLNPGYIVREEVLKFYQLRRHIEDIEEFYKEYTYDDITKDEADEIITCLERECKFLFTLIE